MPIGGFGVLIRNHSRDILNNYGTIDTGAVSSSSADTFGSWVEMEADIGDRDIMITSLQITHFGVLAQSIEVEIGIGAAASEVRIFGVAKRGLFDASTLDNSVLNLRVRRRVPASSRIAIRVKDGEANTNTHYIAYNYIKL